MDLLHELAENVRRHAGPAATTIGGPDAMLITADAVAPPQQIVYEPMLCVILDGAKRTTLGAHTFDYRAGDCLVVSADLPVSGQVLEAPYAAIGIALEPAMIAALTLEAGGAAPDDAAPGRGLRVSRMDAGLIDAVGRLIALLDRPSDAPVLAPMIRREIVWRLLAGEHSAMVRQIGAKDGRLGRIQRVIARLREHYAEPIRIEALAALAGMSETSLHRHFKAVTAMSPLQFQKQVRLQEARNRLLNDGRDIAGVGFAVGYDSPSQFSREYSRQFGRPPGQDLKRLRSEPVSAPVL
ncbi:AraC family transcriptional regulator [Brevundimonas sp. LM2]|uniref:AraC family transcriptional regulator n=1 Tax=Brevundimonas sp. LM2 TaxID=1938605 RepID=UPI000983C089|nr:AraC family transcriptional regulator [Brevundimonas sp. LM2]AQR62373.1 AraC family transcriptional regulator [Brevundimonas sp. LM2]